MSEVLLVTPPFTQLNTPYPATAYLKGYLNTLDVSSSQVDFGIELINEIFSKEGLYALFSQIELVDITTENSKRIFNLKDEYTSCINRVVHFLRQPSSLEAQNICYGNLLPEASRFNQVNEAMDEAFGQMGIIDKAKHYCTLLLEDISDFIIDVVDKNFGFSRYAESIARSASSFDEIYQHLKLQPTFIERILLRHLQKRIKSEQPQLVLITIPFPGNLLGALRIGQWIKEYYPDINISLGGGFVNTELRQLKDVRVFEFCDFITLDDGELPIKNLHRYINNTATEDDLKRTFLIKDGAIVYKDSSLEEDVSFSSTGIPDYSDIEWDKYISVVEVANPMFRLWSDGTWVKLTLAHGCYWAKCAFCDGSLDYIGRYEPVKASITVDRIEAVIAETGQNGFHFVDEAAPPTLLKELAIEIIKRGLNIVWWTNIRFEKNFTPDLCLLLKQSGCIAVAGGLEVASERILKLINKGVTLDQVANVTANLSNAGILVHAYLMYGFPTQTVQETIDSLEVVRQLFELRLVDSGFWHQFALTAHSPVGLAPERYSVNITGGLNGSFANNDLSFVDNSGVDHQMFSDGLKKALYNYMHGQCFDHRLSEWFNFKVPQTLLPPNYIENKLTDQVILKPNSRLMWIGKAPTFDKYEKKKGKKNVSMLTITLMSNKTHLTIDVKEQLGLWLVDILTKAMPSSNEKLLFEAFQVDYEEQRLGDFAKFINSYTFSQLRNAGLLIL